MASIFDIAPATAKVDIRGTILEARGIGLAHCRDLLARFPSIGLLLLGSAGDMKPATVAALFKSAPEAMVGIMATGLGHHEDDAAEKELSDLVLGEQLELIIAIAKLTAPKGKAPFVEALQGIGLLEPPGSAKSGKTLPKPLPTSKGTAIPTPKS